jgi:hypothetical protein
MLTAIYRFILGAITRTASARQFILVNALCGVSAQMEKQT